jgi:hypothetical protein
MPPLDVANVNVGKPMPMPGKAAVGRKPSKYPMWVLVSVGVASVVLVVLVVAAIAAAFSAN